MNKKQTQDNLSFFRRSVALSEQLKKNLYSETLLHLPPEQYKLLCAVSDTMNKMTKDQFHRLVPKNTIL